MTISPVFNHNKTQLIMKPETTMGTAVSLDAASNNIKWLADSISINLEIEEFLQAFASGRHSFAQSTMGKQKAVIKAQAPLLIGAAKDTAPAIGKALKCCGALETITASTSVAYTPVATKDQGDLINHTIGLIFVPTTGNAILITVKGCMGNAKIMMNQSGFPFVVDFEFTGALVGITDGSALALTSPDTGYAPGTLASTLTVASIARQIAKMELDFGNTIELDEDNSDSTGYGAAYIAKRAPKMMIDPKATLLAVNPDWTRLVANTEMAFSMTTAVENSIKYTLTAPKMQISKMAAGKRGSILAWDQTYNLHENAGNDEFALTQSA